MVSSKIANRREGFCETTNVTLSGRVGYNQTRSGLSKRQANTIHSSSNKTMAVFLIIMVETVRFGKILRNIPIILRNNATVINYR